MFNVTECIGRRGAGSATCFSLFSKSYLPFSEPLYVFTDKFALEVYTKSGLSHTIHVN